VSACAKVAIAALVSFGFVAVTAPGDLPFLTGRVVDNAEILSPAPSEKITSLLKVRETRTGEQVAVLTTPSLQGQSIEEVRGRGIRGVEALLLIPFWAMFPMIVIGTKGALILLVVYLMAYPAAKLVLSRTRWYTKARKELRTKGSTRIGGFVLGGASGSSSAWSSSSSSGSSDSSSNSDSFSGGRRSSVAGGSSGSW
jgi:uncharacterized membrane protein YgcG